MNEDEKIKQENKRARQREMVKERKLRAEKYNQELQKSIDDYRKKNEILQGRIEAMKNELLRLMVVNSDQNLSQGIPPYYSRNYPVNNHISSLQHGNNNLQNTLFYDSKISSNNHLSMNAILSSVRDDKDNSKGVGNTSFQKYV